MFRRNSEIFFPVGENYRASLSRDKWPQADSWKFFQKPRPEKPRPEKPRSGNCQGSVTRGLLARPRCSSPAPAIRRRARRLMAVSDRRTRWPWGATGLWALAVSQGVRPAPWGASSASGRSCRSRVPARTRLVAWAGPCGAEGALPAAAAGPNEPSVPGGCRAGPRGSVGIAPLYGGPPGTNNLE
jgi:hypothetical protein